MAKYSIFRKPKPGLGFIGHDKIRRGCIYQLAPDSKLVATVQTHQPLRILHLTYASDAGGLSRHVIDLARASRVAGHHVEFAGDVGVWQDQFDAQRLTYHRVPLKSGAIGFYNSFRSLRKLPPFDLIHAHYRRATLLGRALQRSWKSNDEHIKQNSVLKVCPLVVTLHLSHINVGGWRRWFSDFGDHTIAASNDARKWLESDARVPADRISVIPHGIDCSNFPLRTQVDRVSARAQLGLSDQALLAIFVGRLDHPKNEDWMIDVLETHASRLPNLIVALIGEGPHERALRHRVDQLGLAHRILITGPQNVLPWYQAADALLLPSTREGFSLVCAEAMSVGVPVLRTRTSGTSELIIEGDTGRSVPIDRDAFVKAAGEFLSNQQVLIEMGQRASGHIRDHFRYERQVEETLSLYARLTGS